MQKLLLLLACLPLAAAPPKARGLLRIPVWADAREDKAPALNAKDFSVKLEGEPAKVVSVRGPGDDLMVLLVMDVTEDLAGGDVAKQELISALGSLPPKAEVALLRAQDGLHVLVDPGTDRAALEQAIRTIPVSGKAGLLGTVETASRIADAILGKAAIRLVVLYLTDSNVYNYREDFINPVINSSDSHDMSRYFPEGLVREKISKLEGKLAGLDAPLMIVHLDYRTDRVNEAYQSGLMQLAAATGGSAVFCRSRADIPDAVGNAFRAIASHYSLEVEAPAKPSKVIPVQLESEGRALTYRNRFVFEGK